MDENLLMLLLFLLHEYRQENERLRAILHAEYRAHDKGEQRLSEFRKPGGEV